MQTIEQISKFLEDEHAGAFDVLINGGVEVYRNLSPLDADVEELLLEVVDSHKPKSLTVVPRKPNGSSTRRLTPISIQINDKKMDSESFAQPMAGPAAAPQPATPHDFMANWWQEQYRQTQRKLEKIEEDRDKLREKCNELEKERHFKDKEFELAIREKDMEKSGGLSGVMETVGSNPALANAAAMLLGRIMDVDPATMTAPALPPQAAEEESPGVGGYDLGSPAANDALQQVAGFLSAHQANEQLLKDYVTLTTIFAQNPAFMATVLKKIRKQP